MIYLLLGEKPPDHIRNNDDSAIHISLLDDHSPMN